LRNGSSWGADRDGPDRNPSDASVTLASTPDFYVLNGNATSSSVTLVNAQSAKASVSVPVPLDTIAVAD